MKNGRAFSMIEMLVVLTVVLGMLLAVGAAFSNEGIQERREQCANEPTAVDCQDPGDYTPTPVWIGGSFFIF